MIDYFKQILAGQFEASLSMLNHDPGERKR